MTGSINNIALAGIQNGLNGLQKNANQIASKSTMEGNNRQPLVESLIGIKTNVQQVNTSIKVLEVSDQLIGSILDIKA